MKIIPIALQEHYNSGSTSLAYGLFIKRIDGQTFGFTSNDQDFQMDCSAWGATGVVNFSASQGFDASVIQSSAGFAVDNMELSTLDDGSFFDRDELIAGAWADAEFRVFRYRWDVLNPSITTDVETLVRGWFGEITINQNTIVIELRGITQKLQQPVGIVSTKTCRARLGDDFCGVNLAPLTYTYTVTGVTDKRTFTASGASGQPDDLFGEGTVQWLTGDNVIGKPLKVKSFSNGTFVLVLPVVLDIQVGDTFRAIVGCRKRLMEDCKAKFNNVLNFQGEPHRPTVDDLVKK